MTFRILAHLSFLWMLLACSTTTEHQSSFTAEELEMQDQVWQQMLDGSDRIMQRLPELALATETLETLAQEAAVEANNYHPRAMEAIAELKNTEGQITTWLTQIGEQKLNVLQDRYDHAGVLSFIDKEISKVEEIEETLELNLSKAKLLVEERKTDGLKIE